MINVREISCHVRVASLAPNSASPRQALARAGASLVWESPRHDSRQGRISEPSLAPRPGAPRHALVRGWCEAGAEISAPSVEARPDLRARPRAKAPGHLGTPWCGAGARLSAPGLGARPDLHAIASASLGAAWWVDLCAMTRGKAGSPRQVSRPAPHRLGRPWHGLVR